MTDFAARDDIVSWGRVVRAHHQVATPSFADELPGLMREGTRKAGKVLAHGLGRSYGDTALNPDGALIAMPRLDRLLHFDEATGVLRAEAGLSLAAILDFALPRGYFLPVTPGTRFVTLGGAIANDVHGKNHHRAGTFGCHVRRIGLLRSDDAYAELVPGHPSGLFEASIGGLGLTGIILWAEIALTRIPGTELDVESLPFGNLDEFFALAHASERDWEFTVAWIDALAPQGRGLFARANFRAEGARAERGPPPPRFSIPLDAPEVALNPLSVRAFNLLYGAHGRFHAGKRTQNYAPFFYPLDSIGGWNRLYGRRGLYQYQSVVPPDTAGAATAEMLKAIAAAGQGSFLAVLKTFGAVESPGLLSFPMAGTTLALDFPNRGDATRRLLDRLDAIVRAAGGRLYPAKDGRIPGAMMRSGYPQWPRFLAHRDPGIASAFLRRVEA